MTEYTDRRTRLIDAAPEAVFAVVCAMGGDNGWYSPQWLWNLRGFLDRLAGGNGLVPRRHPRNLELGDPVDFWQVTSIDPPNHLRLLGEMKMPGVGILEIEIAPVDPTATRSRLSQTATFAPKGLLGHLYWIALLPVHHIIFRKMIEGIASEAQRARVDVSA